MFQKVKAWLQRPSAYAAGEWNRMAPRERRLVAALGGALGVAVVLIIGVFVYQSISELEERNAGAREALAAIARHRDEFLEAKAKVLAQEVRIGTERPQLSADLEAAAKEVSMQIAETVERPPQNAGKHYLEHSVDITLRTVDLQSLAKFLAKVEQGRRLIVVTKMRVARRYSEGDKLDVSLTATGGERVKETAKKPKPAAKERT